MNDNDNENGNEELYFPQDPEDPPVKKGRSKRKLTPEATGEPGIKKVKVARKRLEGQARVVKKIAKKADLDKELNKKINPFQSPKVDRPSLVQKLPKTTRQAAKKGPDKIAVLRATPPRTRIRLVEELEDPSEEEEGSEDGEVDENSMDFIQELADKMDGTEDEKQYSNEQLATEVFESFSGTTMPLQNVLFIRKKLFEWRQQGLAKAAANQQNQINQLVISNPVQMKPVHSLSYETLKKLEQEFHIANASAPVQMEQAKLLNSDLHDSLQILLFAETEGSGEPWLESYDDQSWKFWKPDIFFERVFRIFPPHSASREGTLQHKLSKLVSTRFAEHLGPLTTT